MCMCVRVWEFDLALSIRRCGPQVCDAEKGPIAFCFHEISIWNHFLLVVLVTKKAVGPDSAEPNHISPKLALLFTIQFRPRSSFISTLITRAHSRQSGARSRLKIKLMKMCKVHENTHTAPHRCYSMSSLSEYAHVVSSFTESDRWWKMTLFLWFFMQSANRRWGDEAIFILVSVALGSWLSFVICNYYNQIAITKSAACAHWIRKSSEKPTRRPWIHNNTHTRTSHTVLLLQWFTTSRNDIRKFMKKNKNKTKNESCTCARPKLYARTELRHK